MADEDRRPWPRSWIIGGVTAAVAVVGLLLMVGDGDEDDAPQGPGRVGGGAPVVDREFCRQQLEDALEALRPSQLNIRSSADDLAADLNNWWSDCEAIGRLNIETDAMAPLLQPSVLERVTSDRFDPRDAAHIRDCMLYREIAKRIAGEHDSQRTRAEAAFRFAVRQMAIVPGADQPPLPCQYAALFGRGKAAHRAWLTAEVLRQLSTDCVIIEAAGEGPAADAAAALLGVIVPGEGVYLFDAAAGIAVPGAADDEAVDGDVRPATLAEARSRDDLLRRLDVPDGPAYPWTAEQLQDVSVKVIGDSSWWAPRMAGLQNRLPGEFAMTLFDGLTDNPFAASGLLGRVREAGAGGAWNEDDVSVWGFPEAQITAFYAAGGEDGAAVGDRFRVLRAPRLAMRQEDGTMIHMDSPRPLRMVRLEQLSGDLEEALRHLGAVRSAASANPADTVNQLAKEDAVYWIGLCQYALQREETALGNLDIYLREYPFGIWAASVRALRAHCLARLGRYDEAVQAMLEKSTAGRLSFGEAYRVRQWQANIDAAASGEGSTSGPEAPMRE